MLHTTRGIIFQQIKYADSSLIVKVSSALAPTKATLASRVTSHAIGCCASAKGGIASSEIIAHFAHIRLPITYNQPSCQCRREIAPLED